MQVFKELFSSDVGLLSLATIAGVIVIGICFVRFVQRNMSRDDTQPGAR